jgi:hypothetical protein
VSRKSRVIVESGIWNVVGVRSDKELQNRLDPSLILLFTISIHELEDVRVSSMDSPRIELLGILWLESHLRTESLPIIPEAQGNEGEGW